MILKFREAHINDLQKALKKEGTVDLEAETVVRFYTLILRETTKIFYHIGSPEEADRRAGKENIISSGRSSS